MTDKRAVLERDLKMKCRFQFKISQNPVNFQKITFIYTEFFVAPGRFVADITGETSNDLVPVSGQCLHPLMLHFPEI